MIVLLQSVHSVCAYWLFVKIICIRRERGRANAVCFSCVAEKHVCFSCMHSKVPDPQWPRFWAHYLNHDTWLPNSQTQPLPRVYFSAPKQKSNKERQGLPVILYILSRLIGQTQAWVMRNLSLSRYIFITYLFKSCSVLNLMFKSAAGNKRRPFPTLAEPSFNTEDRCWINNLMFKETSKRNW